MLQMCTCGARNRLWAQGRGIVPLGDDHSWCNRLVRADDTRGHLFEFQHEVNDNNTVSTGDGRISTEAIVQSTFHHDCQHWFTLDPCQELVTKYKTGDGVKVGKAWVCGFAFKGGGLFVTLCVAQNDTNTSSLHLQQKVVLLRVFLEARRDPERALREMLGEVNDLTIETEVRHTARLRVLLLLYCSLFYLHDSHFSVTARILLCFCFFRPV